MKFMNIKFDAMYTNMISKWGKDSPFTSLIFKLFL
jgi:hypothetical protein